VDKVIATGLLLVAAVVSAVLLFNVGLKGVMSGNDGVIKAGRAANDRVNTRVEVVYAYGDTTSDEIIVYPMNVGSATVHPMEQCELLLISPTQGLRVPYGSGDDYWSYAIMDAGVLPSERWTTGVTAEFTLHMQDVDTGRHTLTLLTPNGARVDHEFDVI
jgi:hypothetical protein